MRDYPKKIGRHQRKIGRQAIRSTMGLLDNQKENNYWNLIFLSLHNRINHSFSFRYSIHEYWGGHHWSKLQADEDQSWPTWGGKKKCHCFNWCNTTTIVKASKDHKRYNSVGKALTWSADPRAEKSIHLIRWRERKFKDSGMLFTSESITLEASAQQLSP